MMLRMPNIRLRCWHLMALIIQILFKFWSSSPTGYLILVCKD